MLAKLIYLTPLWLIANGIRYSHDNHHLSDSENILYIHKIKDKDFNEEFNGIGSKDFDLIKRVGFKMKHESVLEHSLIVLEIEASRALLQELSRHRIGISPTIKSTRYTLKELKKEKPFTIYDYVDEDFYKYDEVIRASKYVIFTNDVYTDLQIIESLEKVRFLIDLNKSNDIAKYALPEAFKFKGQYSLNLRALVHLLELRTNKDVLPEFQQLCVDMIDVLPDDYKELILTNEKIRTNYERIKNENT